MSMKPKLGYIATATDHGTLYQLHSCDTPDSDKFYSRPARWICDTCHQQWVLMDAPTNAGYRSRYVWARTKEPWPEIVPDSPSQPRSKVRFNRTGDGPRVTYTEETGVGDASDPEDDDA